MQYYGDFIDPLPRIQALAQQVDTVSDTVFHETLSDTFIGLRDLHTNYIMPRPHSCYLALWPIEFTLIESHDVEVYPRAVVKAFSSLPNVMRYAHEVSKYVELGDELVSYNRQTFHEFYTENQWKTGGANVYGGQRSVISFLSYRPGHMFLMPKEDVAVYVLKKPSGKIYSVSAPIVTRSDARCLQDHAMYDGARSKRSKPTEKSSARHHRMAKHPFLQDVKMQFQKKRRHAGAFFETASSHPVEMGALPYGGGARNSFRLVCYAYCVHHRTLHGLEGISRPTA